MTMTTFEPTTIEHLDFDVDSSCQALRCTEGHPRASHLAIWHMNCNCYPAKLICWGCVLRFREAMLTSHGKWRCVYCKTRCHGSLKDIVEIRPL